MKLNQLLPVAMIASVLSVTGCSPANKTDMANSKTQDTAPTFERMKALEIPAPIAKKIEYTAEYHGKTLSDPYHWLKDQGYPEVNDQPVLDYLNEENAYFNAFLEPHTALVDTLFEEFKGRTNDEDESVPYISNGYEYKAYYNKGEEYRTYSRRKLDSDQEEVYLNVPEVAKPYEIGRAHV